MRHFPLCLLRPQAFSIVVGRVGHRGACRGHRRSDGVKGTGLLQNPDHSTNGGKEMNLAEKMQEGFLRNPFAWFLLIAFAIAEYGNYQRGGLDRICELTDPHDVQVSVPRTGREEIDNICISRQPDG